MDILTSLQLVKKKVLEGYNLNGVKRLELSTISLKEYQLAAEEVMAALKHPLVKP
jgi:hypothetical protein